jgi:tRNA (cytosine38-C5)-methyltransferase
VDLVDSNGDKIRRDIPGCKTPWLDPRTSESVDDDTGAEIRLYLDKDEDIKEDLTIPSRVLEKWGRLFDVVLPSSRRSCCFTRGKLLLLNVRCAGQLNISVGYAKFVEGTGSILQMNESLDVMLSVIFCRYLLLSSG